MGWEKSVVLCAEWHHLFCRCAAFTVLSRKLPRSEAESLPRALKLQVFISFHCDPVWHPRCTDSAIYGVCVCNATASAIARARSVHFSGCLSVCNIHVNVISQECLLALSLNLAPNVHLDKKMNRLVFGDQRLKVNIKLISYKGLIR